MINKIPKAELHVHLDGTLTPELVNQFAKKNNMSVNKNIFSATGNKFYWRDFSEFHHVFSEAFKVIKTQEDYQHLTYLYLKKLAEQNCIYAELIVSPFHAQENNINYETMLQGIIDGIDQAQKEFNIEARILMAFLRHFGPTLALECAQPVWQNLHPYVVGINLVGDIKQYEVKAFEKLFSRASNYNLGLSCHAGELDGGPEEIWQAVDILGASRISHGVRCIEDLKLVAHLKEKKILLEVCLTSNITLKMYPKYEAHPLAELKKLDLAVTLNTDDPGFFDTDLNHEYFLAQKYAGFTNEDLIQATQKALAASFASPQLKEKLSKEMLNKKAFSEKQKNF